MDVKKLKAGLLFILLTAEVLLFNSKIWKSVCIIWDLNSFYRRVYKQRYEGGWHSVESNF